MPVAPEPSVAEDSRACDHVTLEQLEPGDAERVCRLVLDRVFLEDVWRMGFDNLQQPRALGLASLALGLLYWATGSVLWSAVLSVGVLPAVYLLVVRIHCSRSHLQQYCQDLCGGGSRLYEHWSHKSDGRQLVVAKIRGTVVGTAAVTRLSDTSAEIQRVAVDPGHTGRGIARQLMSYLVQHCRDKGFQDILIQVTNTNIRAADFYRKLGFEAHTEVVHDGIVRWTAHRMRLQLKQA